jgi:hypothetical protein
MWPAARAAWTAAAAAAVRGACAPSAAAAAASSAASAAAGTGAAARRGAAPVRGLYMKAFRGIVLADEFTNPSSALGNLNAKHVAHCVAHRLVARSRRTRPTLARQREAKRSVYLRAKRERMALVQEMLLDRRVGKF